MKESSEVPNDDDACVNSRKERKGGKTEREIDGDKGSGEIESEERRKGEYRDIEKRREGG